MEEDPRIAEQRAQKERMAAMLFGGMGTGAAAGGATGGGGASRARESFPARGAQRPTPAAASATAVSSPSTSHVSPSGRASPSTGPKRAPDLLDLMSMDVSDGAAAAPTGNTNGVASGGGGISVARIRSSSTASSSADHFSLDNFLGGAGSAAPSHPALNGPGSPTTSSSAVAMGDLLGGGGGPLTDLGSAASKLNGSSGGVSALGMLNGNYPGGGAAAGSPTGSATSSSHRPPSLLGGSGGGGSGSGGALDLSDLLLSSSSSRANPTSGPFTYDGRAVRPLTIATGEFGRMWMSCTGERRAAGYRVAAGLKSPQAVAERLSARLGVHTVEIIAHTAEGICAGQLEGVAGGTCLVHCKVGGTGGEVLCISWGYFAGCLCSDSC